MRVQFLSSKLLLSIFIFKADLAVIHKPVKVGPT